MSLVDHYAALRLLERRSHFLPVDETIKLSLIAVKHPTLRFFPWDEMEKVIHKICQDFGSTTSNPVEGQCMIDKIKEHLDRIKEYDDLGGAILPFEKLLKKHRDDLNMNEPCFLACVHCESALAAILCRLHDIQGESDLHELFQACPSPHSLSFTP